MKKYIFLLLLVAFVFFYANSKFSGNGVLRIGVECDYPPNNWEVSEASKYNFPIANHEGFYADGYDLQIANFVAQELGAKLEVKKYAWEDIPKALHRREIDAIFSGMLDTEERRKNADFSEPYDVSTTEYTIVVNKRSPYVNAKTINDFSGARIIAQKGTHLNDAIDQIPGVIHGEPTETITEMINNIVNYKVDGIVINLDTGRSYERTYRNLLLIRFPEGEGFHLDFNGICAGVHKGNNELREKINRALNKLTPRERQHIMDRVISRLWSVTDR